MIEGLLQGMGAAFGAAIGLTLIAFIRALIATVVPHSFFVKVWAKWLEPIAGRIPGTQSYTTIMERARQGVIKKF